MPVSRRSNVVVKRAMGNISVIYTLVKLKEGSWMKKRIRRGGEKFRRNGEMNRYYFAAVTSTTAARSPSTTPPYKNHSPVLPAH